jgi:hypothetical protein
MSAALTRPRRLTGGLTPLGAVVAYAIHLRNVAAELPEAERMALASELRELVAAYAPRRPDLAA